MKDSYILVIGLVVVLAVFINSRFQDKPIIERASVTDEASTEAESAREGYIVVRMRVTAYCPCEVCCGEWSDNYTASGHYIIQGDRFIAADKQYPFGTEIVIEGYNDNEYVKVLDRGGAIKGDRLDVFFNTHEEALQWGVQYVDVKVMETK